MDGKRFLAPQTLAWHCHRLRQEPAAFLVAVQIRRSTFWAAILWRHYPLMNGRQSGRVT